MDRTDPPLRDVSLLVVDDSAADRALISATLAGAGASVIEAASGEEALRLVDGLEVDLVLLDNGLPGLDGLDTQAALAAAGCPASVVMLTGDESAETAVASLGAGALDHIVKRPDLTDTLVASVSRAVLVHRANLRSTQLQRLALLVTSESDRHVMFGEILAGARRLFGAVGCALAVIDGEGPQLAAVHGDVTVGADQLIRLLADDRAASIEAHAVTDRIALSLPSLDGEPLGVLIIELAEARPVVPEEVELARTFAAFAGTGLQNLRRFEMERRLISELSDAAEVRRQFVATVSHELRTPMTCILGFIDTLDSRWDVLDDETRRDLIHRTRQNAHELRRQVEQLLDTAEGERGSFAAGGQVVDLEATVAATLARLEPVLETHQIVVDLQPAAVNGDVSLVGRAVTNLLSNAVQFSEPGSIIEVRTRMQATSARFEVTDHGTGLDQVSLASAFEPFWRARPDTTVDNRGTGLGLSLVRQYIEAMGGTVSAHSEPGVGSTFGFTLPLATAKIRHPVLKE